MDPKLIVYAVWAVVCLIAWGAVFLDDWREVQQRRKDSRVERRANPGVPDIWSDFGLLLVAIASAVSLIVLILGQDVPGVRGLALAVALGGFAGAGIVKATSKRRRRT